MSKTRKEDNKLNIIKKKTLLKLMKERGITRINPEALKVFSEKISEDAKNLVCKLKQNIQIKAKKTLEKQDILDVIQRRNIIEDYDL